jgi:hypothetical protein
MLYFSPNIFPHFFCSDDQGSEDEDDDSGESEEEPSSGEEEGSQK